MLFLIGTFLNQYLCSLFAVPTYNMYVPAEYVLIAQKTRADSAEKLANRHRMVVIGMTGGLADCVNTLGASFEIQGPLTIEKIRELLIDCVQEFLVNINSNDNLRPFLKNFPFTEKEISIEIFILDKHGERVFEPFIRTAVAKHGQLRYYACKKEEEYSFKIILNEEYSSALKMIRDGRYTQHESKIDISAKPVRRD